MKCSHCEYLYYIGLESNETSCAVFGDETPDEYMRKDGEGCICNARQLAKMYRKNEEGWLDFARGFVEWCEKNERVKDESSSN